MTKLLPVDFCTFWVAAAPCCCCCLDALKPTIFGVLVGLLVAEFVLSDADADFDFDFLDAFDPVDDFADLFFADACAA